MTIRLLPLCSYCKHHRIDDNNGFVCKAYPMGVPARFLEDYKLHLKPWKQKNNIVFAPNKGVGYADIDWLIKDEKILREYFPFPPEYMPKPQVTITEENEYEEITSLVVGSFTVNKKWVKTAKKGDKVLLVREPNNPHDKNAVRVQNQSREPLGYIPRKLAGEIAKYMDRGYQIFNAHILKTIILYNERELIIAFKIKIEASEIDFKKRWERLKKKLNNERKKTQKLKKSKKIEYKERTDKKDREFIKGIAVEIETDKLLDGKEGEVEGTIIKTSVGKPREIESLEKDKKEYMSKRYEAKTEINVGYFYKKVKKDAVPQIDDTEMFEYYKKFGKEYEKKKKEMEKHKRIDDKKGNEG